MILLEKSSTWTTGQESFDLTCALAIGYAAWYTGQILAILTMVHSLGASAPMPSW
jgi:hypothetical protein